MQHLSECPVCHHTGFRSVLTCRDYTVSHETFDLQQCPSCKLVITNPRPDEQDLPGYYQSNDYVSHSNQSKSALALIYRTARTFTLNWKYRLVMSQAPSPLTTILDFGCGTGSFLKVCEKKGLKATGVEPSEAARKVAADISNAALFASLDEVSTQFDAITLWHVLEHVPNLNEMLAALSQRLAQNGTIFIAVPNPDSFDARKYHENWAGFDVPRHLWHFPQTAMTRLLQAHNFHLADILPMRLDAYYVSLLSEKYRGYSFIPAALRALITGFRSNSHATHTSEYSSLIYIARK